jgi:hypothetical protein
MDSFIVSRTDSTAVNCLTGSFASLAESGGVLVDERAIFELGDGYLFEAGKNEALMPSYTFPVNETGLLGMRRLGFIVEAIPIDPAASAAQLSELVAKFGGAVVWVNTAHLHYADIYRTLPPYLHAVVVDDVAADRTVGVRDCMVPDRRPFSCRARLALADLLLSATDRFERQDPYGMGYFHTLPGMPPNSDAGLAMGSGGIRTLLARQASRFAAGVRFRGAIGRYRELCRESLSGPPELAVPAAQHMFKESNVFYAVPGLTLLRESLSAALAPATVLGQHEQLLRHWQALGVLAIRFASSAKPSVLDRIDGRLAVIDDETSALWASIATL